MQMQPIDTIIWSTEKYDFKSGEYIYTTKKYKKIIFKRKVANIM
jgi:hypothetical protein